MNLHFRQLLLPLTSIMVAVACNSINLLSPLVFTKTPTQEVDLTPEPFQQLSSELDTSEAIWDSLDISSYHIIVQEASLWHMQIYDIQVAGGEVTSHSASCSPSPLETQGCTVQDYDPRDYTIPGIFITAHQKIASSVEGVELEITLDPEYNYPSSIFFDNPNVTDAAWSLTVTTFEPTYP